MRSYDDEGVPYVVIERSGSSFMPFVWGALLGAAAALLLAPKSGAETQEELKERARRLREKAEAKAGELQDTLQDALAQGRRHVEDKYDSAKQVVAEGRSRAQEAVTAGKKAAKAARSELEERMAESRAGRESEETADD